MASLHIHQDLYNFEKKRKGLTNRQIKGFVLGAAVCIAVTAAIGYAAQIHIMFAVTVGLCAAMPFVFAGFAVIWGMPADEWADRLMEMRRRGRAITWVGPEVEPMKGEVSRGYKKLAKTRGFECR